MKKILKKLVKLVTSRLIYLIIGLSFSAFIIFVNAQIASGPVTSGTTLTATRWNQMVEDLNNLHSDITELQESVNNVVWDGVWVNVASYNYNAGNGEHSTNWHQCVTLGSDPLVGVKISGESDDGGVCAARVYTTGTNYFIGAITNHARVDNLDLDGTWDVAGASSGHGAMLGTEFLFGNLGGGEHITPGSGDYFAYNILWYNMQYIPGGSTLCMRQYYHDGEGEQYNNCRVDVAYGEFMNLW